MAIEDKRNRSESIKNYAIATSIIVGGLWAAYVFDAKLEIESARAKLEQVNLELAQRPVVIPTIELSIGREDNPNSWLLKITVILENKGNADAELVFGENPVRVARVIMKKGVINDLDDCIYSGFINITENNNTQSFNDSGTIIVLTGQSKKITSLVNVSNPGLYLVQFHSTPGKSIIDARKKVAEKGGEPIIVAEDYVLVGGNPNNRFQSTDNIGD